MVWLIVHTRQVQQDEKLAEDQPFPRDVAAHAEELSSQNVEQNAQNVGQTGVWLLP